MANIPFTVVLLAGGMGTRMGSAIPKQYLTIQNKPLALYSFDVFASMPEVERIVVVCDSAYQALFKCDQRSSSLLFTRPGVRRQDSLWNGIQLLQDDPLVCVHDAARPFIDVSLVRLAVKSAKQVGAAAIGVRVKATIKVCNSDQRIVSTPERSLLWEMQTPQVVRLSVLREGFAVAREKAVTVTDDVALAELAGKPAQVIEGSYLNIKVTTPEDLLVAQKFLENHALL